MRVRLPGRSLDAEHRALLDLVRLTPAATRLAVPRDLDWARLAEAALAHNLAPLLLSRLERAASAGVEGPVPSPPPEIQERLRRDYYFAAGLGCLQAAAFEELCGRARSAGICLIALKGILFGETIYRDAPLRPMTDIDVLVRGRELPAIESALGRLGYERSVRADRPRTQEEMFERRWTRRSGPFVLIVEVHTGLGQAGRYRVDQEGLWARAVSPSILGVKGWREGILALSAEDNLLHLCLHQANHVFDENDLRSMLDLHELIAQWGPDWDQVVDRARRWRILTPLHLCMRVVRQLLGTPVPGTVIERSRPSTLRRRWLEHCIDLEGLGMYRWADHPAWLKRLLVGFALMDSLPDRVGYAWEYTALRARDWLEERRRRWKGSAGLPPS